MLQSLENPTRYNLVSLSPGSVGLVETTGPVMQVDKALQGKKSWRQFYCEKDLYSSVFVVDFFHYMIALLRSFELGLQR